MISLKRGSALNTGSNAFRSKYIKNVTSHKRENPFWHNCEGRGWCSWWREACQCTKVSFLAKCTMLLTNINSDWTSNASSGLCIILICILGCNIMRVLYFASWGVTSLSLQSLNNDISKIVQVLNVFSAWKWCLSQCGALRSLGAFIHSFKFALVNNCHSQHCLLRRMIVLSKFAHQLTSPRPKLGHSWSLVWEWD